MKSELKDSVVYKTTNYNIFKRFEGNRPISKSLVKRLKISISEKQLPVPIIVTEKMEVIDGQHRLEAIKQLGLEVYYVIATNIALSDVHTLNTISAKWTINQYLEAYCAMGKDEYIYVKKFTDKYKLSLKITLIILLGLNSKSSARNSDSFNSGKFVVHDKYKSESIADKLMDIGKISPIYSRMGFVIAYLKCLSLETVQFSHSEFIQKLKSNPRSLTPCTTWQDYLAVIEEIYNYKRQIKVQLKYAT